MDIEQLTKHQLVLLTLLVSFVTSIATGIATVSLLEQAPPEVTRTVNKVVERTVERVTQQPADSQAASVVTKETTVVVKEEDLITDTIKQGSSSLARLYGTVGTTTGTTTPRRGDFLGLGLATDKGVVTSSTIADGPLLAVIGDRVFIADSDRTVIPDTVALLSIRNSEGDEVPSSLTVAQTNSLQLGQTVMALSGKDRTAVASGIISELVETSITPDRSTSTQDTSDADESGKSTSGNTSAYIEVKTNLDMSVMQPGTPLFNLFGEMVAIAVPSDVGMIFIHPYIPAPAASEASSQ